MISVDGVTKEFGEFRALDDVSLDVQDGSLTALLGPSGSGKSTLLRVIAGLELPDAGRIVIAGEDATALPAQRRGIGFVFQHYAAFKHMTVRENVAFGLRIRKRPKAEVAAKVDELLGIVGLGGYQSRYPSQLSGWRSPARWPSSHVCSCSTSRSERSTPTSAPTCARGCAGCTTRSMSPPSW
jgi:sulfate transport system ATP-binding protein